MLQKKNYDLYEEYDYNSGDFSGDNMDNEPKFSGEWRNEIISEVKIIGKRIKNRAVEKIKEKFEEQE